MTTANQLPPHTATPLCGHVWNLSDSILGPMLSREAAGRALWEHARNCEVCRQRFVALTVAGTPPDASAPALYFLETDGATVQPGPDLLFDKLASRSGFALVLEENGARFRLRQVRVRERRDGSSGRDIRRLRLCTAEGEPFIEGDLPEMPGELVVGDNRFRLEPAPSRRFHCVRIQAWHVTKRSSHAIHRQGKEERHDQAPW